MIGRTLSHYKILEEISRGGMGVVYRALDVKLNREVALKVLPPELVADPERKRRFIQEAQAAASLENPHIAVIHEIDEVEGVTFIAMELIHGKMLRDVLAEKRLSVTKTLELATEVAEGLTRAHGKGIVHRDLKPANIMVTDDGHAKIIDFGLAKLVEPLAEERGEDSELTTALRNETDPGKVMGTVAYMSPEQARGGTVDHRSDVFSFGIVLHEMLSGRLPFEGKSGLDTLHAILNDAAPRLSDLGSNVSDEIRFEIQHIVDKCLSKEPSERYQTIEDAAVDLRAARRHLESGSVAAAVAKPSRKGWLLAGIAGLIGLVLVSWLVFRPQPAPQGEAHPAERSTPSIAVLLFDNINQDPELEWMRLGLAEMLVTDLSRSPHMDVLPTDRIYRILGELDSLEKSVSSLEVVQEVAERANVGTVLLGSYMRAGETIRINIRIQEADSGKILSTERVEAVGDSDIFSKVDDLTRRIRASFDVPTVAGVPSLEEVTTSSPEAYRYYAEGRRLQFEGKGGESIPLLERAIELDPSFATAIQSLATVQWNQGHDKQAEAFARQALELGRLPEVEKYLLEARLYSFREEDFAKALEVYERLREMEVGQGWNNAAVRYWLLERYDEAIALMEEYFARSGTPRDILRYSTLTVALEARGEYERAYEHLQKMEAENPGNAAPHRFLGRLYIFWGKLDEAMEAFEKAESLSLAVPSIQNRRWWVFMLRAEWEEAAAEVDKLTDSPNSRWEWQGWMNDALLWLHRGQAERALASLDRAGEAPSEPGRLSGLSHALAGHVLLENGQLTQALERAREAQKEGRGNIAEWKGLFLEGLALAKLGRMEAADESAEKLTERTKTIPSEKEKRRHHHLMGEIARVRGDSTATINELEKARAMLPPYHGGGLSGDRAGSQPYVPIWYSLASTYFEAGDEDKAAEWFQKIIESTVEHVEWPILYVRSFYFLAKIHENRGEMEKAREYYMRFYEFWKDGDMDRERVEEAKRKIES